MPFWGSLSYDKGYSILEFILGPPIFGNYHLSLLSGPSWLHELWQTLKLEGQAVAGSANQMVSECLSELPLARTLVVGNMLTQLRILSGHLTKRYASGFPHTSEPSTVNPKP